MHPHNTQKKNKKQRMTTEIRSLVNAAIFDHFDGDGEDDDGLEDSSELFDYDADSAEAAVRAARAAAASASDSEDGDWPRASASASEVGRAAVAAAAAAGTTTVRSGGGAATGAATGAAVGAVSDDDSERIFALAREVSADESASSEAPASVASTRSSGTGTNAVNSVSSTGVDSVASGAASAASSAVAKKPKKRFSKATIDRGERSPVVFVCVGCFYVCFYCIAGLCASYCVRVPSSWFRGFANGACVRQVSCRPLMHSLLLTETAFFHLFLNVYLM